MTENMMDSSQLNLEEIVSELQVIKCVVVGDTGVGKTRLICSRAFGTKYSLPQLVQTHVPTVWAIDQYRKNPQALQRSWCSVDNVSISLRLWDTFGDHNKDRRFAFGRADVILVCFSVVQPRSLQHVWNHWMPEIQRLCPRVPIVLCGCQVDMRYLYRDSAFLELDKGPFFKEIFDDDVLFPEDGRTVAQQIGAYYYETSVLEQFGIDFLFTNVVRAALVYKRDCHFWNNFGLLKGISRPIFQTPHLPPKPARPEVEVPDADCSGSTLDELLQSKTFCDVVFLVQNVPIAAHKVCLLLSCSAFDALFIPTGIKASTFSQQIGNQRDAVTDGNLLLSWNSCDEIGQTNVALSVETLNEVTQPSNSQGFPDTGFFDTGGEAKSDSVNSVLKLMDSISGFKYSGVTVVTVDNSISPAAFRSILEFLYTGKLVAGAQQLDEVRMASQALGLTSLVSYIANIQNKEEFLNKEIFADFHNKRSKKLMEIVIPAGLVSDVEFKLDDGRLNAHRVLLSSRCDVMASMFSSNFMEGSAKVISYPGITMETFRVLQTYLYTGDCSILTHVNCLELIELANRLCLPRLLAFAEQSIIRDLTAAEKSCQDITEEVLSYLEPAQLHNAAQLANWCLWYLSINYLDVYRKYCKLLHGLRPDNQIYLTTHRHPPLWYLKELDVYDRCVLDVQRERTIRRHYSHRQKSDVDICGCLCFSGRRN